MKAINADDLVNAFRRPTWMSAADLDNIDEDKSVVMTVERILPLGALTLCSAKAKSGKTWFATSLCHAVATGTPFLDTFKTRLAPVLYWCPDDPNLGRFKRIWQTFKRGAKVDNFHLCVERVKLPDGFDVLEGAIKKHKPGLVVVDSYTTIRGHATSGDFVAQEYAEVRRFSEMSVKHECSILLIHHHSKTSGQNPDVFDAAAGSFAMSASADVLWALQRMDNSERVLKVSGRDTEDFALVYRWNEKRTFDLVVSGDAAIHWQELRDAIEGGLLKDGLEFDAKKVADALGVKSRQGYRILKQWIYADVARKVRGNYRLCPSIETSLHGSGAAEIPAQIAIE